ncbi:RUN and SH3 domain-containing protein 1 isoform X1 [Rhinatrema bivittatum]|uniref:RUN and SH3 domain-containing protein 1 isoform X1 n=1 Tax=Rhinatrema bivittatum TaxID=194408 RepID=UPI00112EDF76|nr:RUN and SH3 domain-containing protein 1 isoform X1 [Rhinatrema bivittatum]
MLSPQKGILSNLNHIHLQHVSLGIHLALRPEVQEGPITRAPGDVEDQPAGCRDCQEMGSVTLEVDANSNNPFLQCKCCESHPQMKLGPGNSQQIVKEVPCVADEDAASPSDPAISPISVSSFSSSSISSCSDFTLDDTPVSVYSKKFPLDDSQTSEGQPEIFPLEDNSTDAILLSSQLEPVNHSSNGGYSVCLNQDQWQSGSSGQQAQDTLENLFSGSAELDPGTTSMRENVPEMPKEPATSSNWEQLDSNHNALPTQAAQYTAPQVSAVSEHLEPNQDTVIQPNSIFAPSASEDLLPVARGTANLLSSKERVGRPTTLQALFNGAEEPGVKDHKSLLGHFDASKEPRASNATKKTITSFHELAQRRKRSAAGLAPQQAKKDRSDWLIIFSPDAELPPGNGFTLSTWGQQTQGFQPQQPDPAGSLREVTTFKELKYRHSLSKHAGLQYKIKPEEVNRPGQAQHQHQQQQLGVLGPHVEYKLGSPLETEGLRAPSEAPQRTAHLADAARRKVCKSGLKPITEGLLGEAGGGVVPATGALRMKERTEPVPDWRPLVPSAGPWMRGKADGGDKLGMEAATASLRPRSRVLPFSPLLLHLSADGKPVVSQGPAVAFLAASSHPKASTLEKARSPGRGPGWLSPPEELLPARLSPVGAYSPPHRGFLPLLQSPDLSVLFSPLFPRYRPPTAVFLPASPPRLPPALSPPPQVSSARLGPASELPWRELSTGGPQESTGPAAPPRRSLSLPGAPGTRLLWMADRDGRSAQMLEHKKGLLLAVSFSVDRIISHFSTTRNLVQKAQLGDSRLTPEVGHLLLNTLCPALYTLVGDGLKPFRSDVIVGRRKMNPWSVVEASVKLGPSTRCLHDLYCKICSLSQLSSSKNKFNAFLFGLLNIKQLEFWISHLQKSSGLISVLYLPDGFLALREAIFQHLFEELLLLLQPLSVLSFHLDLLFEHHHLHVDVGHLSCTLGTLPCQVQFPVVTPGLSGDRSQSQQEENSLQAITKDQSRQLGGGQEGSTVGDDESGDAANSGPVCEEKPREPLLAQLLPSHQSNRSLQQTCRRVQQWGDKLAHTLSGNEARPDEPAQDPVTQQNTGLVHASGPASWWGQLSQASRIYSSNKENFRLGRWTKLRRATDPSADPGTSLHGQEASKELSEERGAGEAQSREPEAGKSISGRPEESPDLFPENLGQESHAQHDNRVHRSTGETAAAGHTDPSMNAFTSGAQRSHSEGSPGTKTQRSHDEGSPRTEARRSHDEGSPRTEAQRSHDEGNHGTAPRDPQNEIHKTECSPAEPDSSSGGKGLWLGRLFGAHCSPTDAETNALKSRRPSRWLAPSLSVLDLVRKAVPPEKAPEKPPAEDSLRPQRAVRALCDHSGSEQAHLSFRKGEVLQVLSTVDEDWIRCWNGSSTGLVPVGYTSLIL